MLGLTGRSGIRNDLTRYESLALALIQPRPPTISAAWPPGESPLRFEQLFDQMYREYDQRYVFAAPTLASRTARLVWRADSPALAEGMGLEYTPRVA